MNPGQPAHRCVPGRHHNGGGAATLDQIGWSDRQSERRRAVRTQSLSNIIKPVPDDSVRPGTQTRVQKEPKLAQRFQVGERQGNGLCQLVGVENQCPKVAEFAQLRRQRPRQSVVTQIQRIEAGEIAQLGRDRPRQSVGVDRQHLKADEIAQLRRNAPLQSIADKKQPRNPPIADGYAIPLVQRQVAQPVSPIAPIGTIGGVVERHQSRPVGCKTLSSGLGGRQQAPQQRHKADQHCRRRGMEEPRPLPSTRTGGALRTRFNSNYFASL